MSLVSLITASNLHHPPLRLVKEASYYVKETEENEATLKKMKEDNKGEHPGDAEGN